MQCGSISFFSTIGLFFKFTVVSGKRSSIIFFLRQRLMYIDELIIKRIPVAIFQKVGQIKIVRLFLIIVSIKIIDALPVGIAGIIVHTQSPLADSAGGIAC